MGRSFHETGTVYLTRYSMSDYEDDVEIEVDYRIYPGSMQSYDDPGSPPEVDLDEPDWLHLTEAERGMLEDEAVEKHEWNQDYEDYRDDD